jgi:hypothetical protein
MGLIRTPNDISNVQISQCCCLQHASCVLYRGKFMDLFLLYNFWEINVYISVGFSNPPCHFPVFIMKFLKSGKLLLSYADFITYKTCPIINYIKSNGRLNQWVGKSVFNSKFLTTFNFILFTGLRFGLMQVKTGLCHILSRFEVAPCKDTPLRMVFNAKTVYLEKHGELSLSFNRIRFWHNICMQIKS